MEQSYRGFHEQSAIRSDQANKRRVFGKRFLLPVNLFRARPADDSEPFIPWAVRHIKAPQAWKHATGKLVRVAVIDTGLDFSHPDLADATRRGYNVLDPRLPPHDDNGHGTHIAGTIAARNRESGMTGVAPEAIIYPVKAFDGNGSAAIADIIIGIEWCITNRMDIINMSFGMRRHSKALHRAIRRAHRAGIIIVASAGNDGKLRTDYPGRYPEVIAVGATSRSGRLLGMSNRGRSVDIYAPGEKIRSCWLHGQYHVLSGTSMAAACVSGAIALLLSVRQGLNVRQVRRLLTEQSPARRAGKDAKAGDWDVLAALQALVRSGGKRISKRHMRSGAATPMRRKTLRNTVRMQPTSARRA